jgi:hypothetical protein
MTDKSSWVHSRTQGLFPLVADCDVSWLLQELDDSCRSGGVRSWAWSFLVIFSMMLLLKLILVLACIWNKGDVNFKVLCFRYFSTWVVIAILNSDVCWTICEIDVTCDLLCWITTILACMLVGLKSLVILLDYQSYMGLSMTIWSLQWLFLYLCSYNLGGSVTMRTIMDSMRHAFQWHPPWPRTPGVWPPLDRWVPFKKVWQPSKNLSSLGPWY